MKVGLSKRGKMLAGRTAFRLFDCLAVVVPVSVARRIGVILGDIAYVGSRRYRRVAISNLSAAYKGEMPPAELRSVTRRVFRHFARGAMEFFYLQRLNPREVNRMVELSGTEHIDAALAKGNGAIILTAHYGHWEMLGRSLAEAGYQVSVIARNSDDPSMTGIALRIRESAGYQVLGQSAREALRCLKRNELLGILPDQNTLGGIFVEFFGRPAATAEGPAVFSLKTGAPIIPAFARRGRDGRYHAVVYAPLEPPLTGDHDEDVRLLTQAFTTRIEEEIRKDPAQWLWLHSRWKRSHEAG